MLACQVSSEILKGHLLWIADTPIPVCTVAATIASRPARTHVTLAECACKRRTHARTHACTHEAKHARTQATSERGRGAISFGVSSDKLETAKLISGELEMWAKPGMEVQKALQQAPGLSCASSKDAWATRPPLTLSCKRHISSHALSEQTSWSSFLRATFFGAVHEKGNMIFLLVANLLLIFFKTQTLQDQHSSFCFDMTPVVTSTTHGAKVRLAASLSKRGCIRLCMSPHSGSMAFNFLSWAVIRVFRSEAETSCSANRLAKIISQ